MGRGAGNIWTTKKKEKETNSKLKSSYFGLMARGLS
jgi:hypothetical protein